MDIYMDIAAKPLRLKTIAQHVMMLSSLLSTQNGNISLARRACAEKERENEQKQQYGIININSIEEGAGRSTGRSLDELNKV